MLTAYADASVLVRMMASLPGAAGGSRGRSACIAGMTPPSLPPRRITAHSPARSRDPGITGYRYEGPAVPLAVSVPLLAVPFLAAGTVPLLAGGSVALCQSEAPSGPKAFSRAALLQMTPASSSSARTVLFSWQMLVLDGACTAITSSSQFPRGSSINVEFPSGVTIGATHTGAVTLRLPVPVSMTHASSGCVATVQGEAM